MSSGKTKPVRARTETERRHAFFYAEAAADLYDCAADLNTPLFTLMQQTIFELVRNHRQAIPVTPKPFCMLDIGSGTGAESIPILREYADTHVVAFDLCEPMHTLFRDKARSLLGPDAAANRCQYILGDIASENGSPAALLAPLSRWTTAAKYDLVLSSLTLHHLTLEEKALVYERIASVLAPGGLFVNGDIFSYESPVMAQQANQFGLNWISRQFTTPEPQYQHLKDELGDKAEWMKDSWLDHYINYNLPDPIESGPPPTGAARQRGQAEILYDAGFREVACPFRYWEIGILWARK